MKNIQHLKKVIYINIKTIVKPLTLASLIILIFSFLYYSTKY